MVKASIEFSQVINFIAAHKFTPDELNLCAQMFRDAQHRCTAAVANKFHVGETVQFKNRQGFMTVGRVVKVNHKTIKVLASESQAMWSVSPTLLSKFKKGS